MSADGGEQRQAELDEHFERDLHNQDVASMLADEARDDLVSVPAALDRLRVSVLNVKRQRDELVAVMRDLVFGADCMLELPLPMSHSFERYAREVKRVATAAIKEAAL